MEEVEALLVVREIDEAPADLLPFILLLLHGEDEMVEVLLQRLVLALRHRSCNGFKVIFTFPNAITSNLSQCVQNI